MLLRVLKKVLWVILSVKHHKYELKKKLERIGKKPENFLFQTGKILSKTGNILLMTGKNC